MDQPQPVLFALHKDAELLRELQHEGRRRAVRDGVGIAVGDDQDIARSDGDVVFALATARRPLAEPAPLALARIGALAADCLARAVARAVYEAMPWPGSDVRCWR